MLRHGLRHQALPADVEELLLAAGGSPVRLAGLAETFALPASEVLQAARFFVQELLLHADADAYRVLGVAADADDATIKRHFRALQQWLHPDRLANSPESVYSARVNHAWDLLRTPQRRTAFDAAAAAAAAEVSDGHSSTARGSANSVRVQRWERVEQTAVVPFRPQLMATAGLFVLCVGLLWLALREQPVPSLPEPMEWAKQTAEVVEQLVSAPAGVPESRSSLAPHSEHALAAHSVDDGARMDDPVAADALLKPGLPALLQATPNETHSPRDVLTSRHPTVDGPVATVPRDVAAPSVAPTLAIASIATTPAMARPGRERRADKTAATSKPVAVSKVPATASVEPPLMTPAQDPAAARLLARHQAARAQAGQLLGFLTRRNVPAPPIWRNAPALESAEVIRGELARGASLRRPRVDTAQAHWSLTEQTATLVVPVQPADRGASPRAIHASLVWRDEAWWVDSVSLAAGP